METNLDGNRVRAVIRYIPWSLVAARGAAALALAAGLIVGRLTDGRVLLLFAIAFVTDYFDGVIARAFGVATSTRGAPSSSRPRSGSGRSRSTASASTAPGWWWRARRERSPTSRGSRSAARCAST